MDIIDLGSFSIVQLLVLMAIVVGYLLIAYWRKKR